MWMLLLNRESEQVAITSQVLMIPQDWKGFPGWYEEVEFQGFAGQSRCFCFTPVDWLDRRPPGEPFDVFTSELSSTFEIGPR